MTSARNKREAEQREKKKKVLLLYNTTTNTTAPTIQAAASYTVNRNKKFRQVSTTRTAAEKTAGEECVDSSGGSRGCKGETRGSRGTQRYPCTVPGCKASSPYNSSSSANPFRRELESRPMPSRTQRSPGILGDGALRRHVRIGSTTAVAVHHPLIIVSDG